MSSDFLSEFSELENKIEVLLQSLEEARDENAILRQSSDLNGSRLADLENQSKEFESRSKEFEDKVLELESKASGLEEENLSLKQQVETLTSELDEQRGTVTAVTERVRGLLSKFGDKQ